MPKDYKAIVKSASDHWSREYLYGYIVCLHACDHINMKEAMELIDYAEVLSLKERVK